VLCFVDERVTGEPFLAVSKSVPACPLLQVKASQPSSPSAPATATASTSDSRRTAPLPLQPKQRPKLATSVAAAATTLSTAASTSVATTSSSSSSSQLPSASADPGGLGDFAVLQYIPENMLDMNEDDVLAMVLEQSRSDYINSLRPGK